MHGANKQEPTVERITNSEHKEAGANSANWPSPPLSAASVVCDAAAVTLSDTGKQCKSTSERITYSAKIPRYLGKAR